MNLLDDIVSHKREELLARKKKSERLSDLEYFQRPTVSLTRALRSHPIFGIIAEVKRSSPTAGVLRKNISPAGLARDFQRHGAAAVSVLTDECFFSGALADLSAIR